MSLFNKNLQIGWDLGDRAEAVGNLGFALKSGTARLHQAKVKGKVGFMSLELSDV